MKALLFIITLLTAITHCWADESHEVPVLSEDEVIWETERIIGRSAIAVSPNNDVIYIATGSEIQIRSVATGELLNKIFIEDFTLDILSISISRDGNLLALSGDDPYLYIFSLSEKNIIKKLTFDVFEREDYGESVTYETEKWLASDISPDGDKITGIIYNDQFEIKTSLIVFDINSNEILIEERRLTYDRFNPGINSPIWHNSEFSKDGTKIIAELENLTEKPDDTDSLYIYSSKNMLLDTIFEYNFISNFNNYHISPDSEELYIVKDKNILIYSFKNRNIENLSFENQPRNLVYPYNLPKILLRFGVEYPRIFDYKRKAFSDELKIYKGIPQMTTLNNDIIYIGVNSNVALIKIDWDKTTTISTNKISETTISPNPTNGVVKFSLDCSGPEFVYSIYSSVGAVLESDIKVKQGRDVSINFSTYPTGVYFVSFLCNGELKTYKIIKEG